MVMHIIVMPADKHDGAVCAYDSNRRPAAAAGTQKSPCQTRHRAACLRKGPHGRCTKTLHLLPTCAAAAAAAAGTAKKPIKLPADEATMYVAQAQCV
jgi:hypothetical protein